MSLDRFNHEEEVKLIEYISQHKCLFDSTQKDYQDIDAKDKAWKEIASKMEGKTEECCRKRWRSMRDHYKRIKREGKIHSSKSRRPQWHLMSHLAFLDVFPYDKRPSQSSIPPEERSQSEDNEESEETDKEEMNGSDFPLPSLPVIPTITELESTPTVRPKKRKSNEDITEMLNKNKEERQELIELISRLETNADEIDLFYKSIALSVKRLPPHMIAEVRLQHLRTVTEVELRLLQQQRMAKK